MAKFTFSSFFEKRIVDQNNISVSDINLGLNNSFTKFVVNEQNLEDDQRYLVSENEENYPDLVALHSNLQDASLWWWFMMTNRLDDPLKDVEVNYTYSIVGQAQMQNTINDTWANNIETSNGSNSRIGQIIELN